MALLLRFTANRSRVAFVRCFSASDAAPCPPSTKRMWEGADDCLSDHKNYIRALPGIMGAYVGPNAIEPQLNEAIMLTVNSAKQCPYCTGLHGELARMAGVEDSLKLNGATSVEECRELVDEQAITYARTFAESDGKLVTYESGEDAYALLVDTYGAGRARSIRSLCLFLHWGSLGGNTLNHSVSQLAQGNISAFRAGYVTWYGPLFGVIALMNAALPFLPKVPSFASSGVGVVLTVVGGSWLAPVGLAGLYMDGRGRTLEHRQ